MVPTRLLLVASLLPAISGLMMILFGNDQHMTGTIMQDAMLFGLELATSCVTLGLTWHEKFFRFKPFALTSYIIMYVLMHYMYSIMLLG